MVNVNTSLKEAPILHRKRNVLRVAIASAVICLVAAAIFSVKIYFDNRSRVNIIKTSITTPVYSSGEVNRLLVESEPSAAPIQSNTSCNTVSTPANCTLGNDGMTVITAQSTFSVEGKDYRFVVWDGCDHSNTGDPVCRVMVQKGASVKIKAYYVLIQPPTPSAGVPSASLSILDQKTNNGEPPYVATFIPPNGATNITATLKTQVRNLDITRCNITLKTKLEGETITKTETLKAVEEQQIVLADGTYRVDANCPDQSGVIVRVSMEGAVYNRQPKLCKDFSFSETSVTAESLDSLVTGIHGTWEGCVSTPWTLPYYVTMKFNEDGTYSAVTKEILDDVPMNAMYYGTQDDSPEKTYTIMNFQASKLGLGEIHIVFSPGDIAIGKLENIRLMGDSLSFDFYHLGEYGPLTFRLHRK